MTAVTDHRDQALTPSQIEGMHRFNENDVSGYRLRRDARLAIFFEIDAAYEKQHHDQAAAYAAILPTPLYDVPYIPLEGELLTCAKQWKDSVGDDNTVLKQFQVVRVGTQIEQTTASFRVCVVVYVIPVEQSGLEDRRVYL